MKKLLIVLLLIISTVSAGCVLGRSRQDKVEQVEKAQQEVKTLKQQEAEEIDTSEWKIYRNEEYGLEFKYPSKSERFSNTDTYSIKFIKTRLEVAGSVVLKPFDTNGVDSVLYIKHEILKDADPNCIVKTLDNSDRFPEGYAVYFIQILDSAGAERFIPFTDEGIDCTEYAGSGNAYFIHNKEVPNRILHIAIYQDPLMSYNQINKFLESIIIFN